MRRLAADLAAPGGARRAGALAAIVALGAALRFIELATRSFWYDEAATIKLLNRSFGGMLRGIPEQEGTPPLYYILAYGWTQVFGTGEAGARSLSAVLGTLTILVAYTAARRAISPRAGLAAALVTAVAPPLVWFSQDARTYALAVLLAGLAFVFFQRARASGGGRDLALWSVAATASIASHYFAAFAVAAEAVLLLGPRADRRRVAAALALPLAASAALAVLARAQSDHGGTFIADLDRPRRLARLIPEYIVGFQPPAQVVVSVLGTLLLLPIGWLLWRRTDARERAGARAAAIVGATAVLVPVVMAFLPRLDYLLPRNTMTAWVPLSVVAAAGLGARRAGAVGAATLTALCALAVTVTLVTADRPKFDHSDWRGAARALGPCTTDRAIVTTPRAGWIVLPLYLPGTRLARRAEPLAVREVDVIGLPPSFRALGRPSRPPRPRTPDAPAGFTFDARTDSRHFTLVRYRAAEPVTRVPNQLNRLRLATTGHTVTLIQRCS